MEPRMPWGLGDARTKGCPLSDGRPASAQPEESGWRVHDDRVDTLHGDFSNFDLGEEAQLRVVNRMPEAWQLTRERIEANVALSD